MATELVQLRNKVEAVMRSLCLNGEPRTNEIIAAVKKQHANMVRRCSPQLIDTTPFKLVFSQLRSMCFRVKDLMSAMPLSDDRAKPLLPSPRRR